MHGTIASAAVHTAHLSLYNYIIVNQIILLQLAGTTKLYSFGPLDQDPTVILFFVRSIHVPCSIGCLAAGIATVLSYHALIQHE
jgi:hypothetical protein